MDWYYFNFTVHHAQSGWERRTFLHKWWRLCADDRRWVPPYFPTMQRLLRLEQNPYLAQRTALPIHLEALPRRRQRKTTDSDSLGLGIGGAFMEEPVAATFLLSDRRREGCTAYLGLLQFANDLECVERLWDEVSQRMWELGCQRVLGPTGLSPHLSSGALQNFFHITPPLHTPYNPPYLPELMQSVWEPIQTSHLYHIEIPAETTPVVQSPVQLSPLSSERLAQDLFPLFEAACISHGYLAPPDRVEVSFLLEWLQTWPLYGWLAEVDGQPVGFVLLQPDLAPSLLSAHGGRNWGWRLWLKWRRRQPVHAGRLLYGAVLPAWRGRGIGRRLWQQILHTAYVQQWQTMTIGPVVDKTPAAQFLTHMGAKARQQYVLYGSDL